ncbi:alpha-2-macroglobulin [Verrucomicrobiaceae bacterium N1E253]|uniref:Alpha-2-macroglobulin n=1 Tax=Oceaniferula marina TaxID=2748318 RepID=A0A851GIH7_9BACT|nr:MG2 domain-containing protein [Oceaniferula marina]NWK55681.1 alpha-2-macroglobulin [Oceaniferula marina]
MTIHITASLAILFGLLCLPTHAVTQHQVTRNQAQKLQKQGNYKEALAIYQKLIKQADNPHPEQDLERAEVCLDKLKRIDEFDQVREQAVSTHPNDPSLLRLAAVRYLYNAHDGSIIAGEFKRGPHRGDHLYADATERDRIRALQLLLSSIKQADKPTGVSYQRLAEASAYNRTGRRSWKLQELSNLDQLPDYRTGDRWGYGGRNPEGAPVRPDGTPLFYSIPESWQAATNDGERWRWALNQQIQINAGQKDIVIKQWADFLHSQFGVQTLASYSWFHRSNEENEQKGILQVHTLKDDETIAKLASGVKRFKLPDDQNFIKIYQDLSTRDPYTADHLVGIYLNRRQHDRAAQLLIDTLERFPKNNSNKTRKKRLQHITGDWGRFDTSSGSFAAGKEAKLDYVFRNAKSVTLTVRPIDTRNMVDNLWKYIEGNPSKLKWDLMNWSNLGEQVVNDTRKKYVGKEIARRSHDLTPRPKHWDTRKSLSVPVSKPGAYLVTANLDQGVSSHTVIWIDSQVIISKSLKNGTLYLVTDAVTGKPVPSATLEFFGYQQKYRKEPSRFRKYDVLSQRFTKTTGDDGSLMLTKTDLGTNYQWMVRGSSDLGTCLLGFSRYRQHHYGESTLKALKSFGITDRPVYQPKQTVFGKFWVREARYDLGDQSTYAGTSFTLHIRDAAGNDLIKDHKLEADTYGGVEYKLDLPEEAKLGTYRVRLTHNKRHIGYHSFQVEEYKKPEYEVSIDAPTDPVILGETFKATVKARYYHGAPVTHAKVKVKVTRNRHNDLWFPAGRWDWLYGNGYGWFDVERPWFPGWKSWGCFCPRPSWWHRGSEAPEMILEQEFDIGADGTVKVEVDTTLAKTMHSDTDHRYSITAEVVDASRRMIVGSGQVIAARKPYQVSVWLDRGYARSGQAIQANVACRSADGKTVNTKGQFVLYQIHIKKEKVEEKEIQRWQTTTEGERNGQLKFQVQHAGQFRLAAIMRDDKGREIEGAILFTVRGDKAANEAGGPIPFSDIELITDKRTYIDGDTVQLLIQTKRPNSTVLLSLRGGQSHRFVKVQGQSSVVEIPVTKKDMPNFFVEAATVSNAKVHTAVREIIVPPEKRILKVEVIPNESRYKPRAKGKVKVRVTDQVGEPVEGSLALTIYDKSIEYISGGSNISDIKSHFWKWKRHFRGGFHDSLSHYEPNVLKRRTESMRNLGVFGHSLADAEFGYSNSAGSGGGGFGRVMRKNNSLRSGAMPLAAPAPAVAMEASADMASDDSFSGSGASDGGAADAPAVMIRKDFADLVKWIGAVETDAQGVAEIPVTFPDNLTTWKIKTWAMSHGTRVGEGTAEVITSKDLIIRLQAPRFFVEKDEVVLSAVVHNDLKTDQQATVSLELEGDTIRSDSPLTQKQTIKAGDEARIDWRCQVLNEGEAVVRMKVITPDDSDAMEMRFPVYVHGILKQSAWSRVIAPEESKTKITIEVPAERRPDQSRLEIRYSPTIAGSIVDALPYLADYPYGCTEQTLNRFVPTVITQKLIREMGINLEDVKNKRANLNPQEIGDDKTRMAQWKRWQRNPVFDAQEVAKMTRQGVDQLGKMQLGNGGWGWFSGYGERAYPHTTAVVVHGLLIAKQNDAKIPERMLNDGIQWLQQYEATQSEHIRMWKKRKKHTKQYADARDALVRMVLAEAGHANKEMLGYLFRDKNHLSVYAKSLAGMACHLAKDEAKRDALIRNIMQFLVYDEENQSAHLKLGNEGYWWFWYGSEIEAHAWFLKLLSATQAKSKEARGLVKYLINNRKHATYWKSTRDTAYCIEAIADYMRASGENHPEAEITVSLDGKKIKTVSINKENLFSYDNKVVINGDALSAGTHLVEVSRKGPDNQTGPLYTNAYLTVFTKEDNIKKTGLEVKVDRAYYKLERIDASETTAGTEGQVVEHKIEKYKRIPLKSEDVLVSGDLVEVELHIHSKNDYEYLMFNDWKPAGLEAVEMRSGYTNNGMGAYMEMHHEKTSFFVRRLPRGEHSLSYRLRAEIPGRFSALPTQAEAMYAPELKANSDEIKIQVKDR